jgi:hypothetical protein
MTGGYVKTYVVVVDTPHTPPEEGAHSPRGRTGSSSSYTHPIPYLSKLQALNIQLSIWSFISLTYILQKPFIVSLQENGTRGAPFYRLLRFWRTRLGVFFNVP